jgi:hypothetical protein
LFFAGPKDKAPPALAADSRRFTALDIVRYLFFGIGDNDCQDHKLIGSLRRELLRDL